MNSRMEKYGSTKVEEGSRTLRNQKLYENQIDLNVDYIDLNNAIEIIPGKNESPKTREEYKRYYNVDDIVQQNIDEYNNEEIPQKERVYDINEILKKVKEEKKEEERKRLINTEYNILTKLNIDDIKDDEQKNEQTIKALNESLVKEELKKPSDSDLFEDLIDEKELDEITGVPLQEEKKEISEEIETTSVLKDEKKIIEEAKEEDPEEKKENFLDTSSTTTIIEEHKKSKKILIFIIILVIMLLAVGIYLFLKYFGTF